VHHLTQRGFNDIAYTIMPMSVRHLDGASVKLSKDLTRHFVLIVDVPPNAGAGVYKGAATLTAGELKFVVADIARSHRRHAGRSGTIPRLPCFGVPDEYPPERVKHGTLELADIPEAEMV